MDNPFDNPIWPASTDIIVWRDYLVDQIALHEEPEEDGEEPEMELVEATDELAAVEGFIYEAEDAGDWEHGETLIPEDDFEQYARDFADDIGAVNSDFGWPLTHIDWESAAADLRQDYIEATYRGRVFLIRA